MRRVQIVAEAFAIVDDDTVIAVVTKCNETQWGVYPLVPCGTIGVSKFIPLQYALEEALKLNRT